MADALQIVENLDLRPYHTFGLSVKARYFCQVTHEDGIRQALKWAQDQGLPYLILGGGSNMLPTEDFPGLVIAIRSEGIAVRKKEADNIWIQVAAGENWHHFVQYCLAQGWYGIENLSLIPGSCGAAPMQNIGAYGVEIKDVFDHLEALVETSPGQWQQQRFDNAACQFGYRESVFKHELKGKAVITSVCFRLSLTPQTKLQYGDIQKVLVEKGITHPSPLDLSEAVIHIRQSKLPDPNQIGNAGSFFKNPEIPKSTYQALLSQYPDLPGYPVANPTAIKVPAGWLIERAGWKGHKRPGHTPPTHGVHERQALVLVNYGGATGQQIWQLALDVQASVLQQFGIRLEPEVNRVGRA